MQPCACDLHRAGHALLQLSCGGDHERKGGTRGRCAGSQRGDIRWLLRSDRGDNGAGLRQDHPSFPVRGLSRAAWPSLHAAQLLAQDYRSSFEGARRLALSGTVAARLASLLLDWGRSASSGKPEMGFTMTFSHEALAGFAGTTRETVTRTLGAFQKKELIRIRGTSVRILAEAKLARLAG